MQCRRSEKKEVMRKRRADVVIGKLVTGADIHQGSDVFEAWSRGKQ